MSISNTDARVRAVELRPDALVLELEDGTKAAAPLEMFPILRAGSDEERARWKIIHGGRAVRWPLLDEDISVFSVLHPKACIPMAPEAVERHLEKLRRWRARRAG